MSSQDLNRTEAFSKGKTAADLSITADQLAKDQAADTNATGQYSPSPAGSRGTANDLESGSILPNIPGYVIEGELGRGGMGVVYQARQNRPQEARRHQNASRRQQLPTDMPASDAKREVLAKRQANAAVALLRMNRPEKPGRCCDTALIRECAPT